MVAVGLIAGTLAGLLGIGGGIIMVPAMMVGLGMSPSVAKGTSAAVIVPTAIIGHDPQPQDGNVDVRIAVIVGTAGAVTAVIAGGIIADQLSDTVSNVLVRRPAARVAVTQLMTLRFREPRDRTRPSPG